MAEILEKQVCPACGVDVRPKALFCFNCGSQVGSDEEVEIENQRQSKLSSAWFKEEITEGKPAETMATATVLKKTEPVIEKTQTVRPKAGQEVPEKNAPSHEFKTAASLRDRSRPPTKRAVQVVWEEPKSAPNVWFLIVSLILIGFVVLILFAMLYIR